VKLGLNEIELIATDGAGNQARAAVRVERRKADLLSREKRYCVGLTPLNELGPEHRQSATAYDALLGELKREPVRFNVVDRSRQALELVLLEHNLAALGEPEKAIRLRKLLSAEGILFGEIGEGRNYVDIYIRLVDTETGEILCTANAYGEGQSPNLLLSCADRLVWKLRRDFPLVWGEVMEVDKGLIYINIGKDHALRKGMRLLFYREMIIGTNRLRQPILVGNRQVEARVADVDVSASSARPIDNKAAAAVERGDKVVTK